MTVPANSSRFLEPDELRAKWQRTVGDSGYDITWRTFQISCCLMQIQTCSHTLQARQHTAKQDLAFDLQKHQDAMDSACDKLETALADLPGGKSSLLLVTHL